jgi:hypothetical protein
MTFNPKSLVAVISTTLVIRGSTFVSSSIRPRKWRKLRLGLRDSKGTDKAVTVGNWIWRARKLESDLFDVTKSESYLI